MAMPSAFRAALAVFLLAPLLSACGGASGGKVQSASAASSARPAIRQPGARRPLRHPPAPAVIQRVPGLEAVIGSTAAQLAGQFGDPRLDVWEGDARKLQFSGESCVLDIYLYPPAQGREPQATYVDARRADGQETDKVACATGLRKR